MKRDTPKSRTRSRATLTARRHRFVEEYPVDLNATQAAIRAGFSPKVADREGHRLLRNAEIAAAIKATLDARAERTSITQDRVLAEVALLAFSDVTHYRISDAGEVQLTKGAPEAAMRAVQSIKRRVTTRGNGKHAEVIREVEIRLWEKPGPLKLAGQHVGLFTDRIEHSGKVTLEQVLTASRQEAIDA